MDIKSKDVTEARTAPWRTKIPAPGVEEFYIKPEVLFLLRRSVVGGGLEDVSIASSLVHLLHVKRGVELVIRLDADEILLEVRRRSREGDS